MSVKEPINWRAQQGAYFLVSGVKGVGDFIADERTMALVAVIRPSGKPLVDKRNAQLIARAGRMQAAIKAVITSLDTGGESSRTLAREIAILRQSLK